MSLLETWSSDVGLKLGPLLPTEAARHKVLSLFYHYRHLNCTGLEDLSCTDLITHRVRVPPLAKPVSNPVQKKWAPHIQWWLQTIVEQGLAGGIYEHTEAANGRLSRWNARAVVVDKVENPTPQDEPRVTFDYSRVPEELPATYMELSSRVHDTLSDPRHRCLFTADLKHAYLTIGLHPDDRHYFAFTISGLGQLQPTRMQQGSKSAGFTMTELIYRCFGPLPEPHCEPSLLHSSSPRDPPPLVFYVDDFFGGFDSWESQYDFLKDHFLPRLEWGLLRLSFKKLRVFMSAIKALGITHCTGGEVRIIDERVARIAKWPLPCDKTRVRAFLGVVGITRRWVRNFAEIARPLTRLTGNSPWKWGPAEQLSFEILQIKCATRTSMHGIDMGAEIHFYTDASGYAAGLAVTQFRTSAIADSSSNSGLVEVPILYDSFPFAPTRRLYATYKKELYAIVYFVKKYDYLCKHPFNPTIIHTDHKPLVHFLSSDLHEGIYGHWADCLRRYNIEIKYIPGHRNKVADGLSRTLFDEDCFNAPAIQYAQYQLDSEGAKWIWKDGQGGFEAFLNSLSESERSEVVNHGTIHSLPAFSATATGTSWEDCYRCSDWFGDVYSLLEGSNAVPSPTLLKQSLGYRILDGVLWKRVGTAYLPCVPEGKVLPMLIEAHDESGHWGRTGTTARLRGRCYWPHMSQDVDRYITGCIQCARHGPATRSQPLNPILVTYPFQLIGMDFIGPLSPTEAGSVFILNTVCYFSRFMVPFACKTANVEDVTRCLEILFSMYRVPHAIYCDSGQHFDNARLRKWLAGRGVSITYSSSGASKSTGMVEMSNRLIEEVLRKDPSTPDWDRKLLRGAKAVNGRSISHLNMSPAAILFGPLPETSGSFSKLYHLPGRNTQMWHDELRNPATHSQHVQSYIRHRADTHDRVKQLTIAHQEKTSRRYDRGIRVALHQIGDLVMLWQNPDQVPKLGNRWRGPFQISGYGGTHGRTFTLKQLNGSKIRGTFHGDHLKTFVPRLGYLADPATDATLPLQQTIRRSKLRKQTRS